VSNISPASIVSSVLLSVERFKAHNELESILDVGSGKGVYGYFIKSYIPGVRLDAIEPKPPKITYEVYDSIIKQKIEDCIDDLPDYDIILLLHILKHLPKKTALQVLKKCRAKSKLVIFGVPSRCRENGLKDDDGIDSHKSFFSELFFQKYYGIGKEPEDLMEALLTVSKYFEDITKEAKK